MEIIERYNRNLHTTESGTITMLNRVLDASFNRLVHRARVHMQAGYNDPAQRNLALLQEFRMLVPSFNPNAVDGYDRILRNLVGTAGRFGITVADELTGQVKTGPRVDVSIPLESTIAAAGQAKGYLRRHGEKFAETAAQTVAQGIAEGRPTDAMVQDMRARLGVVKSRAEAIVRTESLRAYNDASNTYYAAQGIELVMYYATADDRLCPFCAPRAAQIYRRAEIKVPLHPRCRCYLAPWDADVASMDPDYAAMRKTHKSDVAKAFASAGTEPVSLNKAAVFEQLAPTPLS